MNILQSLILIVILTLPSSTFSQDVDSLRMPEGYKGRIGLVAQMDEPGLGYCLDVPGPANNILLHIPVWVHSCHSSPLIDQVFQFNLEGNGQILWIHEELGHELCLTAKTATANSSFAYQECAEGAAQNFDVNESGQFILRGTNLCMVATNMAADGAVDEIGVAKIFFDSDYTRTLELQPCGTRPTELEQFTAFLEP